MPLLFSQTGLLVLRNLRGTSVFVSRRCHATFRSEREKLSVGDKTVYTINLEWIAMSEI